MINPLPIPYDDFGGSGPLMHFAHANGYPPCTYEPLLQKLANNYRVVAMRMRPLWQSADPMEIDNWRPFAEDMRRFFDQIGADFLLGVGHSFGANITLRLALLQPDRFQAIILIDPVLLPSWTITLWSFIYRLGWHHRLHPYVNRALTRRTNFGSKDDMFSNYRQKSVFRRIDDRGLRAYVDALAISEPNGKITLSYTPAWEARIYETGILADKDIWELLSKLKPPVMVIRGENSNTFWQVTARRFLDQLPDANVTTIKNTGHLVALERPKATKTAINNYLNPIVNKYDKEYK